jgi:hypothetical protein
VDILWKSASSATADTAQPGPQRSIQACLAVIVHITLLRLILFLRRLRVPEIDVQALDLFDQQENRLAGRAQIVAAVRSKTRAPRSELVDLALVQTIVQRSPRVQGASVRRINLPG